MLFHLYATIGRYRRFLFVGRHFQWTESRWFSSCRGDFRVLTLTRPRRFPRLGRRSHRLGGSHLASRPGLADWRAGGLLSTGRRPQGPPGVGRAQELLGEPGDLNILLLILPYQMMLAGGGCWGLIVHSEATGLVDDLMSVFNWAQNSLYVCVTVLEYLIYKSCEIRTPVNTREEDSKCYLLSARLIVKASLKQDNEINFTRTTLII